MVYIYIYIYIYGQLGYIYIIYILICGIYTVNHIYIYIYIEMGIPVLEKRAIGKWRLFREGDMMGQGQGPFASSIRTGISTVSSSIGAVSDSAIKGNRIGRIFLNERRVLSRINYSKRTLRGMKLARRLFFVVRSVFGVKGKGKGR